MNKVAQVTIYFWIMKICATTLGETGGDLLSMTMNVGYAVSSIILLSVFLTTLLVQLGGKKISSSDLLGCNRHNQYGRHNHFRLHG
jgi:uncharacterized membrane-anchored protein